MKKLVTKLLVLVLLLTVALSFTACGSSSGDDDVISVFRWDYSRVETAKENQTTLYRELSEEVGADFEIRTAPSGDWQTSLGLLMSTLDVPDVFVSLGPENSLTYEQWIDDDLILPIGDYVNENNYPYLNARLEEYSFMADRVDYMNGKMYSLPVSFNEGNHAMFINYAWIDAVNEKDPLTGEPAEGFYPEENKRFHDRQWYLDGGHMGMQEFYYLAKAFSDQDPDGDGKNDTFGYTAATDNMWFNHWIFTAFGGQYSDMVPTDYDYDNNTTEYTASYLTDESKEAVYFINRLYNEGIMNPEYIAIDSTAAMSQFVRQDVGIYMNNFWYNSTLSSYCDANSVTMDKAMEDVGVILPPYGEGVIDGINFGEDGAYGIRGNDTSWCVTSISSYVSDTKREKILHMLDFMLSPEGTELFSYGMEGETYEFDENGEKVSLMGESNKGQAYTLENHDGAWPLYTLVDWTLSAKLPFTENAEFINDWYEEIFDYAKPSYARFVTNDSYVANYDNLFDYSVEEYVAMIKSSSLYNNQTAFDESFETFKTKVLSSSFKGQTMIDDFNASLKSLGLLV